MARLDWAGVGEWTLEEWLAVAAACGCSISVTSGRGSGRSGELSVRMAKEGGAMRTWTGVGTLAGAAAARWMAEMKALVGEGAQEGEWSCPMWDGDSGMACAMGERLRVSARAIRTWSQSLAMDGKPGGSPPKMNFRVEVEVEPQAGSRWLGAVELADAPAWLAAQRERIEMERSAAAGRVAEGRGGRI